MRKQLWSWKLYIFSPSNPLPTLPSSLCFPVQIHHWFDKSLYGPAHQCAERKLCDRNMRSQRHYGTCINQPLVRGPSACVRLFVCQRLKISPYSNPGLGSIRPLVLVESLIWGRGQLRRCLCIIKAHVTFSLTKVRNAKEAGEGHPNGHIYGDYRLVSLFDIGGATHFRSLLNLCHRCVGRLQVCT